MKRPNFLITAAAAAMLLGGCALRQSAQSRTTAPPPGPARASTAATDRIPAGTEFTVRTNEDITSTEAGRTFSAQLAQDIVNSEGRVLARQGSPASLTVYKVDSPGTVGTASLQLGVSSITVDGRRLNLVSNTAEQRGEEGLGRNRRTAEHVGAGAVLGTVIGAIAGGGKGAAIGAAVGAAGGAAAQVITRGKEVRVPAETVLSFRLDEPARLAGD